MFSPLEVSIKNKLSRLRLSMVSPEFSELYDELYGFYRVNPVEWE